MKTTISHDGFARQSVVREKASGECAWCGQLAKFRYGTGRQFPLIYATARVLRPILREGVQLLISPIQHNIKQVTTT